MMVLASHQPDFFPYMGYFYKMFKSDIFVFSDNVLYSKTGRHDYNMILTSNGPYKFKMPITYHVAALNELQIAATEKDITKMKRTLYMNYKKAKYFDMVYPIIEELLDTAFTAGSLAEFNHGCIMRIASGFGLTENRKFLISSELGLENRRDARIIEMCNLLGADVYISGSGAKDYHVEEDYRNNNIELVYSDYQPVSYPQVWTPTENMSVIDYIFNCGFELPRGWTR